eukprot:SAG22_NODE_1020_length_5999_cov_8.921186_5_plen_54_part_00
MVLDEFYEHLEAVGVSALTGEGCTELFAAIDKAGEQVRDLSLSLCSCRPSRCG